MENLMNVEDLEFVAECRETEEQVVFTMGDLYGWDDETVFIDTGIYLNRPRELNWAIICKSDFGRRLNPKYNIHIRTEAERVLKEPLRLLSVKKYSQYRFEAEFNNHVVRTGSFSRRMCCMEELPFGEEEFEHAEMNARGLQAKNVFISAMELWKASSEYVHYGCHSEDFALDKFQEIRNIPFSTKPSGGFWASPTRIDRSRSFDWRSFCSRDRYCPRGNFNVNFYFCLDINARVFRIENMDDYKVLPKICGEDSITERKIEFIDFEECMRQGIDAIEYAFSSVHKNESIRDEMDRKMLGWDCDSILIMNPKIILSKSFLETIHGKDFLAKGSIFREDC